MIRKDISVGDDPVMAMRDIVADTFVFYVDGRSVSFPAREVPFTLTYAETRGRLYRCADKALILKHENLTQ